jgi:hypothetical protein
MIRLDYVAAKTCPDAASFTEQLQSRAPHVLVASDASAREVKIRITSRANHFSGRISIAAANGESLRSVDSDDCTEVVTALAVIGAFTLDPVGTETRNGQASIKDSTTGSSRTGSTDAAAADANASPDAEKKTAIAADPKKPAQTSSLARNPSPAPAAPSTPRSVHAEFSFGANAEVITGIAPGLVGSVPVFAEISLGAPKRVFSPSARLRFERPGSDAAASSQGSAHFTWTEASLDLCPIALWLGERVRLRPCLRAEVGIVDAAGVDTTNAHDETRPWTTLGAVAIGRLNVVGPLFVELEAVLIAPLVRDRFYLDPQNTTVFRASPVGASMAAGAGISIW